jgi:hypothetical protein
MPHTNATSGSIHQISGLFMTTMEFTKTPQEMTVPMSEQMPSLYNDFDSSCSSNQNFKMQRKEVRMEPER